MADTIPSLLGNAAELAQGAPALLGLSGSPLTYSNLVRLIDQNRLALRESGIARTDRIAVMLPNGPHMAACFLSVSSAAVCAPLNPTYSASEFEFFLGDLKPAALMVDANGKSPASSVADKLGIPVLRMIFTDNHSFAPFHWEGAGSKFDQSSKTGQNSKIGRGSGSLLDSAQPDDVALLLHTSGSTSRPKLVPLTHRNLCVSAENIGVSLALSPHDRCLNIMPLFHIHGLIGALLSSLAAGASVICTPGFDSPNFLDWLSEFSPTWYTAVPTMHQSIVDRIARSESSRHGSSLRFIRSCSSALPAKLMADLEKAIAVPVIEAYGMTEASHQMATNPLPPGKRKPGSVGIATGCEIAIRSENGALLAPGAVGDIVIRGSNVTRGYENNAEANAGDFADGWFSTGDRGHLDEEGHLFLSGRTKEIINRGGEKISPREIDEVLLDYPGVAQAMAFALPDARLGEDVAALVVLRESTTDLARLELALRGFVGQRLADFKVPSRILFVDEMPKGPTGKPQRIGLAERLGLSGSTLGSTLGSTVKQSGSAIPHNSPEAVSSDMVETTVAHLWEDLLRRRPIGLHEDFFELGGDSLLAARMITSVEKVFAQTINLIEFAAAPTIVQVAALLRGRKVRWSSNVVALQSGGSRPPLFFLGFSPLLRPLVLRMSGDQPEFAISPVDPLTMSLPFRLEDMATRQIQTLRESHPHGPYMLAGWCMDGVLAYEMARQLTSQGEEVPLIVMFDSVNPLWRKQQSQWASRLDRFRFHFGKLVRLNPAEMWAYGRERSEAIIERIRRLAWRAAYKLRLQTDRRRNHQLRDLSEILSITASQYTPSQYSGRVAMVRPQVRPPGTRSDAAESWKNLLPHLDVIDVPGNHIDMFREPYVEEMARRLDVVLQSASAPSANVPPRPDDFGSAGPRSGHPEPASHRSPVKAAALVLSIFLVFYFFPNFVENRATNHSHQLMIDLFWGDLLGCLAIAVTNWKLASLLYIALAISEYLLFRTGLISLMMLTWLTDLVPTAVISAMVMRRADAVVGSPSK